MNYCCFSWRGNRRDRRILSIAGERQKEVNHRYRIDAHSHWTCVCVVNWWTKSLTYACDELYFRLMSSVSSSLHCREIRSMMSETLLLPVDMSRHSAALIDSKAKWYTKVRRANPNWAQQWTDPVEGYLLSLSWLTRTARKRTPQCSVEIELIELCLLLNNKDIQLMLTEKRSCISSIM